jgi:hypothetical protein
LPWFQWGCLLPSYVVMVVYDGCHGGMEDGEQAQGGSDAIRAVPERRRCEKM